jgi:hypothetical protein
MALNPRFAGSNPADSDGFLTAIKIRSTTSFGGEVKPLPHVVIFYGILNIPIGMSEILTGKIQRPFLGQFLPASLLDVSAATRAENSFYESGMIRTHMGKTIYHNMIAVAWDALYDTTL